MLSRLRGVWTVGTRPRTASRARRTCSRRPLLEALEGRVVLSLFPGEIHVNNTLPGNQFDSDNATNTSGNSVVVWTSNDAGNNNIRAQRYDDAGIKVGPEILVAGTNLSDTEPAVSMDNAGNFVVVWTQGAGAGRNIIGQRFNAGGGLVGGLMGIAVTNAAEFDPDVAVATGFIAGQGTGAFVVTYTRSDGANENVFAHMRRSDGTIFNNLIPIATNADDDFNASVARAPGGAYAIAFQTDAGANSNIFLQRRNAAGGFLNNLAVANTVNDEDRPDVDLDTSGNAATPGNAVVVWEERLGAAQRIIRGRKVNAAGGFVAASFVVDNLGAATDLTNPVVALRGNGNFVVAYERAGTSTRVREMNAALVPAILSTNDLGGPTRVGPAISIVDTAAGPANYLVTYTKSGAFDDILSGIYGRYGSLA